MCVFGLLDWRHGRKFVLLLLLLLTGRTFLHEDGRAHSNFSGSWEKRGGGGGGGGTATSAEPRSCETDRIFFAFFFLLSYTTLHSTGDGRGEEGKLLLVGLKPRLRRQTDDRTDGQHELKYIALLRKSTLCLLGSSGGEKRVSFFFPNQGICLSLTAGSSLLHWTEGESYYTLLMVYFGWALVGAQFK